MAVITLSEISVAIQSELNNLPTEKKSEKKSTLITKLVGNDLAREYAPDDEGSVNATISERISRATGGSLTDKEFIKEEIYKILVDSFSTTVTVSTIDTIIQQYHVNYYEPLYTGPRTDFADFLNSMFLLHVTDEFEKKLRFLCQILYQESYGLSVIDGFEYMKDINEIAFNGYTYVWAQYKGIKSHIQNLCFVSEARAVEVAKRTISYDAKSDLNNVSVEVLCQRANGSRITALQYPYISEITTNIRNFDLGFRNSKALIEAGFTNAEAETFIDDALLGRPGIVVIGDMGSGKTSYLSRLIAALPDYLSIGTIEPMFELNAKKRHPEKNIDELQTLRDKTVEDCFETFLRANRDIIITGEIRSPAEALVALKSMLRQGRGSMGTFHCTSAADFPYDFRNLLMQSKMYTNERSAEIDVARAVDLIILIRLNRRTGKRFIGEIAELMWVKDADYNDRCFEVHTLFKYDRKLGLLVPNKDISPQLEEHLLDFDIPEENLMRIHKILNSGM